MSNYPVFRKTGFSPDNPATFRSKPYQSVSQGPRYNTPLTVYQGVTFIFGGSCDPRTVVQQTQKPKKLNFRILKIFSCQILGTYVPINVPKGFWIGSINGRDTAVLVKRIFWQK